MGAHKFVEPPDNPDGYVKAKRFFSFLFPDKGPKGKMGKMGAMAKPAKPPEPPPQWKVEAHATQYFRNRSEVCTSILLAIEPEHLLEDALHEKYDAQYQAWVESYKLDVQRKKWIGSRGGRNPGLMRTADMQYVLFRLSIRPK